KQTQIQLVQSAKMASVGLLAGGVAHEINNPLTGVLNNLQLINMIAKQKEDFKMSEFKELLCVIQESAVRCKRITQSLLDFSHASKGVSEPLSPNEALEKVITLVEHELKLNNIVIQKDLEPDLPLVKGESQLLQQVIFDLIVNAKWAIQKKSAKEGGLIAIRACHEPADKVVRVHVSDTGIGIPRENLDKIFEPFFTTKEIGEGTGLGLSVVYNIIKAHNGKIEVESELGKGTTFTITLPTA
ncbi:MAG: ATP-binding protein, partial [Candidatus Omnitrophota bacterium]